MDKRSRRTSDKDHLDYYHSPPADQGPFYQLARHSRQPSTISTSSSEYSSVSDTKDATSSDASSQATRRSSVPSEGSMDRRRIAIVEMEPLEEKSRTATQISHDPPSTLRSRRGLQTNISGLAIVAPPDVSPSSYALDPPSSAPIRSSGKDQHRPPLHSNSNSSHHYRSASEFIPSRKTLPRDIGIVGTTQLTFGAKQDTSEIPDMQLQDNNTALRPPIFQQPKSATPSPSPSPDPTRSLTPIRGLNPMKREKSKEKSSTSLLSPDPASAAPSPVLTPKIGEEKDVHVPVAAPIVVGLDAAVSDAVGGIRLVTKPQPERTQAPVSTTTTSTPPTLVLTTTSAPDPTLSYVNYQPGVHSTAGPLPPPPRLPGFEALSISPNSPPPPRPPRLNSPLPPRNPARSKDLEAVKHALQLPPSVSVALAAKTPTKSKESLTKESRKDAASTASKADIDPAAAAVARSTSTSTMPSSPSFSDSSSSSYSMLQPTSSIHRREGAFPPSSSDPGSESIDSERGVAEKQTTVPAPERPDSEDVPQVTVISEPPSLPSPILESAAEEGGDNVDSLQPRTSHHHREQQGENENDGDEEDSNENWVSVSRVSSPSPHYDRLTSLDSNNSSASVSADANTNGAVVDRGLSKTPSEAPSPPPKSFRNSLTTGLKRLSSRSLPRTPSISSGSRRSSSVMSKRFSTGSANVGGGSGVEINQTPWPSASSAPLHTPGGQGQAQAKPVRRKIVAQWPSAMYCNEIHAGSGGNGKKRMSTSERCAIYAQKINELYMYDCGLTEWVLEMRFRGPNSNSNGGSANKKFPDVRSPASAPFAPQPRQTSRSSMISEMTFPTRPDASTATDLLSSSCNDDGVYREDVPVLPYPSLASAQRAAASNVIMTPPASIRSLGSNSTIPSMNNSNTNTHPHTPASTLTSLSQTSTTIHHTSTAPLNKTTPGSASSGGGFFATLGRKASLTSAKKPSLGLGLGGLISSPISASSSSSSGVTSPLSSNRLLSKPSSGGNISTKSSPSKPVNVGGIQMNPSTPPSVVPGGPRAPPGSGGGGMGNRVQRSKTFMPTTSSPFGGGSGGSGVRNGAGVHSSNAGMERRPSLWELQVGSSTGSGSGSGLGPGSSPNTPTTQSYVHPYTNPQAHSYGNGHGYMVSSPTDLHQQSHHHSVPHVQHGQQQHTQVYDPHSDPEFVRQVDRLADLLPHADRTILAGYLRRAGQDVLAIGQYLEDEKNGTLKAY